MDCVVRWGGKGGMTFHAETGSGHLVSMDGAPEAGGRNLAARPMEMLLVGAGGCTGFDVVMILQRGRHEVEGCVVRLAAERAAADPKVFTRIHLSFTVSGRKLPREAVERAVRLSHDKYCSATQMLGATATITHDIDIVDTEAA